MDRLSLILALNRSHQGFGEEAERAQTLKTRTQGRGMTPEETAEVLASLERQALLNQNATLSLMSYLERIPDGCEGRSGRQR
jgi:hypothetical protein